MFKINEPGLYFGVKATDYFADPCPDPSLTQSIAKILVDKSPGHARWAHPRLNPEWEADDPTKFDIGNIAHSLLLGRGKEIEIIKGFADWRKDEPKRLRLEAIAAGKCGVLEKDYQRATVMVQAARVQLEHRGLAGDFDQAYTASDGRVVEAAGDGEVVAAARVNGVGWCRAMIDWLPKHRRVSWDYKTTDRSAAPDSVKWRISDGGWDFQAAMHERLLDILDPVNAGRRKHRFIVQERDPPFALSVVELTEAVLTMGRKRLAVAERLWAAARADDVWPLYDLETQRPEYPPSAEREWLDREVEFADRGVI